MSKSTIIDMQLGENDKFRDDEQMDRCVMMETGITPDGEGVKAIVQGTRSAILIEVDPIGAIQLGTALIEAAGTAEMIARKKRDMH